MKIKEYKGTLTGKTITIEIKGVIFLIYNKKANIQKLILL